MQQKKKETSGFWPWIVFFLGFNMLIVVLVMGIYTTKMAGDVTTLNTILTDNDMKQQPAFTETMAEHFALATQAALGTTGEEYINENWYWDDGWYYNGSPIVSDASENANVENWEITGQVTVQTDATTLGEIRRYCQNRLANEGVNLLYYIKCADGTVLTNTVDDQLLNDRNQVLLPNGYDYFLSFNGDELKGYYEKIGHFDPHNSGYGRLHDKVFAKKYEKGSNFLKHYPELAQCQIVLAVKSELEENDYGYSALYHVENRVMNHKMLLIGCSVLLCVAVILIAIGVCNWRAKRRFEERLIDLSAKMLVEFKLMILFGLLFGVFGFWLTVLDDIFSGFYGYTQTGSVILLSLGCLCFWGSYLIIKDMVRNKRTFFKHNLPQAYLRMIRSKEDLQPFQEKLLKRFYMVLAMEILLLLVAIITCWTIIIPLCAISFGVFLLLWYVKGYKMLIEDIGKIDEQIERIKSGDMESNLILSAESDLYPMAQNLNSVQEGFMCATEEQVKSERMKVALLTNVSHDLKTPLTSIISYVDLLSREEGLNDTMRDYVRILKQKADRLKALINDLFDLSKATSSNLDVTLERIDFGKLLNQVLAELADTIEQAPVLVKTNIPKASIPIISDGNKMHRVLDNLLLNALKYSLEGSRVYVDLEIYDGLATATIKNTAKYEMDFDADTIVGRFVRGDKSRSTEGSGLGLAIAQSYTEACGGRFDIALDGDLFKVTVTFDTAAAEKLEHATEDLVVAIEKIEQ